MPAQTAWVDHIPVLWVDPGRSGAPLALWLTHLGGSKERSLPFLEELAAAGFVALSLDPWRHGERGSESPEEIYARVLGGGSFRREMWPTAGQTTLDCLRVIDWAAAELGTGPELVAGGVSMGGDTAVALAGIEPRVTRVAALVATPDWKRPGMQALEGGPLEQGEPDAYAQWFYDRLDPLTHADAYRRGVQILFECGGDDAHVPADGALRFRDRVGEHVQVNVRPGRGHIDGASDAEMLGSCLDWLSRR